VYTNNNRLKMVWIRRDDFSDSSRGECRFRPPRQVNILNYERGGGGGREAADHKSGASAYCTLRAGKGGTVKDKIANGDEGDRREEGRVQMSLETTGKTSGGRGKRSGCILLPIRGKKRKQKIEAYRKQR